MKKQEPRHRKGQEWVSFDGLNPYFPENNNESFLPIKEEKEERIPGWKNQVRMEEVPEMDDGSHSPKNSSSSSDPFDQDFFVRKVSSPEGLTTSYELNLDSKPKLKRSESNPEIATNSNRRKEKKEEDHQQPIVVKKFNSPDYGRVALTYAYNISSDANMNKINFSEFLIGRLPENSLMICNVYFNTQLDRFEMVHRATGRLLMIGVSERKGMKRLDPSIRIKIYATFNEHKSLNKNEGSQYLGKLRSDARGKVFQLFDDGKGPWSSSSFNEVRSEYLAVKFERLPKKCNGRKTVVCIPKGDIKLKCTSSTGEMTLCDQQHRPSVMQSIHKLVNHLPNSSEDDLPSVKAGDFEGAATRTSVKNMILHDVQDTEKIASYAVGKISNLSYNVAFRTPFSPLTAFGLAMASIQSNAHLII